MNAALPEATGPAITGPAPTGSQASRWLAWGLDRNSNGVPYPNLNNAVAVLESDLKLRSIVWFDDFLQRILTGDPAREWTDADDITLNLYLQREVGLSKMTLDVVRNAVIATARRDRRNCVRDWMDSLIHDGQPRIASFFQDVFGAEDNQYTQAAGRNFWISIIARVYSPGCKVDNMVVLEGAQGLGKSQALAIIGGAWYAAQHESATNSKAFAEVLQGKLIVEIEEMDAFNRAESTTIKKVVSCQSDRYRVAYGRHAADHPRQCVMVGTTNKNDHSRDETGARRSWPIRCEGMVRLDLIRDNRDQLFAEAVAAYRAGAHWWEMPAAETKQEQRARFDADPWLSIVERYAIGRDEVVVNDVLCGALNFTEKEISRTEQMRIASCLRYLGWERGSSTRRAGNQVRPWTKPPQAAQT